MSTKENMKRRALEKEYKERQMTLNEQRLTYISLACLFVLVLSAISKLIWGKDFGATQNVALAGLLASVYFNKKIIKPEQKVLRALMIISFILNILAAIVLFMV